MDQLLFTIENGIAKITLNRPEKYNAFIEPVAKAFQNALKACANDSNVRVVVITGNGKAFCAGQDLKEATDDNGLDLQHIVKHHYNPIIKLICALEKPVLAAVNGIAAGAGANIALACDIVVAKESASFIQAFSKIGLIPDSSGTYFLPRIIGQQKASALMMLGDKVSATEAESMGMIYKVFSDDTFEDQVQVLANKLALMPTKGLALTKKILQLSWSNDLETQLNLEEQFQTSAGATHDYKEGTTAFLEKRPANFKGE